MIMNIMEDSIECLTGGCLAAYDTPIEQADARSTGTPGPNINHGSLKVNDETLNYLFFALVIVLFRYPSV
jgi:hypothetical protein